MTTKTSTIGLYGKLSLLFLSLSCLFFQYAKGSVFQDREVAYQSAFQEDRFPDYEAASSGKPPKSTITISEPESGTVWTVSEPAKIKWTTENINPNKSIRFFLAKDDMVVQELGRFENNFLAEGIELAKNVGSGDGYQVVGIELFPDNKFQVAKYATSYFSIRNPVADARKAAALAKRSGNVAEPKKNPNRKEKKRKRKNRPTAIQKENAKTTLTPNTGKEAAMISVETTNETGPRNQFEGRNISYVKDLTFTSDKITVSLWDHGRQDGDIVSIYLNGEAIVSKHLLTYGKKKVSFKLDASKTNDLFLYAHNLGSAPPNTVSIELTDGKTSEKIILNSDLKSCEAVQIKVQ